MTGENNSERPSSDFEKQSMRWMWVITAVVVLFIVGIMGANVMFSSDHGAVDVSSQSRRAPAQ